MLFTGVQCNFLLLVGGLPTSTNLSGAPLDTAGFRFAHQVQEFPGIVFRGNGECSPHSTYDYLSVRTMLVPTLEREAPAIRVRALLLRGDKSAHQLAGLQGKSAWTGA